MPSSAGRPGSWLLATGVLHLDDGVARGWVKMAALCRIGGEHRVQPGKKQEKKDDSANGDQDHPDIPPKKTAGLPTSITKAS